VESYDAGIRVVIEQHSLQLRKITTSRPKASRYTVKILKAGQERRKDLKPVAKNQGD